MSLYPETPRVPADYPRLKALSQQELGQAIRVGYVRVGELSGSAGSAFQFPEAGSDDLRDWRMRMYVLWFAYMYETFFEIEKPLASIEDLFLEFKTNILNGDELRGLAQLYAGAGAWEPTAQELKQAHERMRVYYNRAIDLLESCTPGMAGHG